MIEILGTLIAALGAAIAALAGVVQIVDSASLRKLLPKRSSTGPVVEKQLSSQSKPKSNLLPRSRIVGRETETEALIACLAKAPATVAIVGMAGIGKSTLAHEVSHKLTEDNPNIITIYVDSSISVPSFDDVLLLILRSYGLNYAFSSELTNKIRLIEDYSRNIETLFVFDSFENIEKNVNIRSLISSLSRTSRIIISSKNKIDIADDQSVFTGGIIYKLLDPLKGEKAFDFFWKLNHEFGNEHSQNLSLADVESLVSATGGVTLAMRWAIAQLSQGRNIAKVVSEIQSGTGGVLSSMFSSLWVKLSKAEKNCLLALAMFVSPPTMEILNSVSNSGREFANIIRNLERLSLISIGRSKDGEERLSLHPLTHSFLKRLLIDSRIRQFRYSKRYNKFYEGFINTQGGDEWDWGKFDRLEAELQNIWKYFLVIREAGMHKNVLNFREKMTLFLSIRGHWDKRIELAEAAMASAKSLNLEIKYAWCAVYDYAYVELKRGDLDKSKRLVEEGLEIFTRHNDVLGIATAKRHLGRICQGKKEYLLARELYDESLQLYASQDSEYRAFLLWDIGDLASEQADNDTASRYFIDAYESSSGIKGKSEAIHGMASGSLGEIYLQRGELYESELKLLEALQIAAKIGRADEVALNNYRLSKLAAKTGKLELSVRYAEAALTVYSQLGDTASVGRISQSINELKAAAGKVD